MERLDEALAYARRGWSVFPLRGKLPAISKEDGGHGCHDATTDEEVIRHWWSQESHNIGIATGAVSALWVLDIDGDAGEDSLAELEKEHGKLPATVEAFTGKGRHLYFRLNGENIGNKTALSPGLDIRADGGYVVAPTSYHRASKRNYEWSVDGHPDEMQPAKAPAWLIELVGASTATSNETPATNGAVEGHTDAFGETALKGNADAVASAPVGKQEDTLNRASFRVGKLVGEGCIAYDEAFEALVAAGLKMANDPNRDPWTEEAVREKVKRAVSNGMDEPRRQDEKDSAATIAMLEELAKKSAVDYERERKTAAKDLGMRTSVLDDEVAKRRAGSGGQGTALTWPDIEPWVGVVGGDELMADLVALIGRHVVLPSGSGETVACWAILSHCFNAFDIIPRLAITSPVPGCGKTTLMDILQLLTPRPLLASNISPAAVFRVIEAAAPTMLIDEGDSFLPSNDELRGILNSGHKRAGAFVVKTVGDDHEPRKFSTWAPMAIAGIGKLPDTLASRSIAVRLERKTADQRVEALRGNEAKFEVARRRIARFVADLTFDSETPIPPSLQNRDADNWAPLFAIADKCGAHWGEKLRAIAVSADGDKETNVREQLLADLQTVFDKATNENLSSQFICDELAKMEESPWPEWKSGKPMTTRQLAAQLRHFRINPQTVRIGRGTAKGYKREQLEKAWRTYANNPDGTVTTSQAKSSNGYSAKPSVTSKDDVTDGKRPKPNDSNGCDDVTDENPD